MLGRRLPRPQVSAGSQCRGHDKSLSGTRLRKEGKELHAINGPRKADKYCPPVGEIDPEKLLTRPQRERRRTGTDLTVGETKQGKPDEQTGTRRALEREYFDRMGFDEPTVEQFIRHAERFGPEEVYEAAELYLDPQSFAGFSPSWRGSQRARSEADSSRRRRCPS